MKEKRMWQPAHDSEADDEPRRPEEPKDALTSALGAPGFLTRHVVRECRETFENSVVSRNPERFDRYYFETDIGPVLVDLLVGDQERQASEAQRKRVEFKRQWCQENDRKYLVFTEHELADETRLRAMIHAAPAATPEPAKLPSAAVVERKRARGQVSRPKAAVGA